MRNQQLLEKYKATQDEDYLGTIALNLHGFYTGVERCFEEIARNIDETVPSGANWHQRLLRQMSAALPSLRPVVIQPTTRQWLDEYRGFRHVVINVYSFDLQPDRVLALAENLSHYFNILKQDFDAFCEFMETVS